METIPAGPINYHRVAACQLPAIKMDQARAIDLIKEYAAKAEEQGAVLVCFPECFLQGYVVSEQSAKLAIDLSGEYFKEVLKALGYLKPALVIGMIERFEGKVFNTAVVIGNGKIVGAYRKLKLRGTENDVFEEGGESPVFEVGNLRFGINICYDLNFSETAHAVASQGIDLLVCPCNNMMSSENSLKWKEKHNEVRANRAREEKIWLVSSDVTGYDDNGYMSLGPTAVINPDGVVVSQLPLMEPGLLIFDIPKAASNQSEREILADSK